VTDTKKSKINPELDKYLAKLLKDVMSAPDGENAPTLTDKMKVVDRVLKWEAIKGKLNDGDWGSSFADN
jgi:hypothetical protein